jgi:hypothetical protein
MLYFLTPVLERLQRAATSMLAFLDEISSEEQSNIFDPDSYKATSNFDVQTTNSQKYVWVLALAEAYFHRLVGTREVLEHWVEAWKPPRKGDSGENDPSRPLHVFLDKWDSQIRSLLNRFQERMESSRGQRDRV